MRSAPATRAAMQTLGVTRRVISKFSIILTVPPIQPDEQVKLFYWSLEIVITMLLMVYRNCIMYGVIILSIQCSTVAHMIKRPFILQEYSEGSKPLTQHRSFDNPIHSQKEVVHPPVRSKSVISAFFLKQKTPNLWTKGWICREQVTWEYRSFQMHQLRVSCWKNNCLY